MKQFLSTRTRPLSATRTVLSIFATAAIASVASAQPPGSPGGPGGFGGPGGRGGPGGFGGGGGLTGETPLVAQFDKNGDKRLDATERAAAAAFMAAQGGGRGGFGGRGGRGGQAAAAALPGIKLSPSDVKSFPNAPLYDVTTLRTFFIEFENPNWEKELVTFNNTDVDVPAKITVDGKVYKDVGVHFRGASSFFMVSDGFKRSLNLTFDFTDDKQNLYGYRTLNLLNANGDATFMRSVLYTQMAREYIPAAKANFVRVVINGENWGIYASVEQFNKEMVNENFNTTKGARWKVPGSPNGQGYLTYLGDNADLYKNIYTIKTKDDPKEWTAFTHMLKVMNQTPPDQLVAALSPLLDIDGALKFLALDNTSINEDGYWTRASDYSIYHDEKGLFHIIPHDTNETFSAMMGGGGGPGGGRGGGRGGPGGFGGPGGPGAGPGGSESVDLSPLVNENNPNRALAMRLLAVPALRAKYLGYVKDINDKWINWKKMGPVVQQYAALIGDDVAKDTKKLESIEAFRNEVSENPSAGIGDSIPLKTFFEKRHAYLDDFLAKQGVK